MLIGDTSKADVIYDQLPESDRGRIISTDIARHLDDRYHRTPKGRPRDLAPSWDGAWRYAQDRLERELGKRRRRKMVRFMAGGWAAGKTHALEQLSLEDADLVWDGTLKDVKWASAMIRLAVSHGWKVEIAYVFRDLELALFGAVERAAKEGRGVPLHDLPAVHRDVQQSILELMRRFGPSEAVNFVLLHNTGFAGHPGKSIEVSYADLEPFGALHYTRTHEHYYRQAAGEIREACIACGHLQAGVC